MAAGRKAIDISEWLTPENKLRIQGWCRDGLIEIQISDYFLYNMPLDCIFHNLYQP